MKNSALPSGRADQASAGIVSMIESEIAFADADGVFGALPIVDVGEHRVPPGNAPGRVAKRKPANLTPTVRAVEASNARLEVIGLT